MRKIAGVALLAETTKPMFAYQTIEASRRGGVLVRAVLAQWTVPLQECFAYRAVRIESELVGLQ
jgi:hypothetical protein